MRKKFYLSACCILKDEDPFIMEWLTYHSLIGVEHFFVYDNESKNPLEQNLLIQNFVAQGKVTLLNTPGKAMQCPAYTHCLQNFGALSKWIAFLDLDEFICPLEENDLRPLLAAYEDYAALGLSWKCFSSGGHLSSPAGLVIKNYQERFLKNLPTNLHIKSIIQPDKNSQIHTPHSFFPNSGEVACSTINQPITRGTALIPVCWKKATVHHYILKSQQDAQRRMVRGRADIKSDKPTIDYADFYRMVTLPVEHDDSILRFAPEVETWLAAKELPETYSQLLNNIPSEKLISMAEISISEGKYDDAAIMLCHAAMEESENPKVWKARARLAGHKKQEHLVRLFSQKAARIKVGLPSAIYPKPCPKNIFTSEDQKALEGALERLFLSGKHDEADAKLEALATTHRLSEYMWVIKGEIARLKKDFALAEKYIFNALEMEENLQSYKALAQIRIGQGRYKDAKHLVHYLIHTGTQRADSPDFYTSLQELLDKLNLICPEWD